MRCDSLDQDYPGIKPYIRTCDADGLCASGPDLSSTKDSRLIACRDAIGHAGWEFIKGFVTSPYTMTMMASAAVRKIGLAVANGMVQGREAVRLFYADCNNGDDGKRWAASVIGADGQLTLAPNIGPGYAQMTCDEIYRRVSAYQQSVQNMAMFSKALSSQHLATFRDVDVSGHEDALQRMWQCANPIGKLYVLCYELTSFGANFVDPLAVAATMAKPVIAVSRAARVAEDAAKLQAGLRPVTKDAFYSGLAKIGLDGDARENAANALAVAAKNDPSAEPSMVELLARAGNGKTDDLKKLLAANDNLTPEQRNNVISIFDRGSQSLKDIRHDFGSAIKGLSPEEEPQVVGAIAEAKRAGVTKEKIRSAIDEAMNACSIGHAADNGKPSRDHGESLAALASFFNMATKSFPQ